jgi:gamma-glutamyltranspeptidase / glutathione hydrolase
MKKLMLAMMVLLAGCGPATGTADGSGDGDPRAPEPDASFRPEASGMEGAVAAGHPLAAAAGYEVLRAGGNAVDAAVTMAGVLAVVRPHMNGVGGDAFALVYDGASHDIAALNGTGRSAALATPDFYAEQGLESMPQSGALAVTVPGAVSAWAAALGRHGTITLARALEPAIALAEDGFVVSATLASDLSGCGA